MLEGMPGRGVSSPSTVPINRAPLDLIIPPSTRSRMWICAAEYVKSDRARDMAPFALAWRVGIRPTFLIWHPADCLPLVEESLRAEAFIECKDTWMGLTAPLSLGNIAMWIKN